MPLAATLHESVFRVVFESETKRRPISRRRLAKSRASCLNGGRKAGSYMGFVAIAEQVVNASLEVAFARFVDYSAWDQWMPSSFRPLSGPARALRLGDRFTMGLGPSGKLANPLRVHRLRPNKELCWAGGVAGLLAGEHSIFFSEADDKSKTKLRSEDVFAGVFTRGPLGRYLEREATKIGEQVLSGFAAQLGRQR
jgi:hypothetical protein